MSKEYFNKLETDKIFKLKKTNPSLALEKYEKYFEEYPKDYSSYCYYIDTLIALGKFQEAEDMISKVNEWVYNDNDYMKNNDRKKIFDRNMHYAIIRLLFCKGKYNEVLQYINTYKTDLEDIGIGAMPILCRKKLGISTLERINGFSYLHKQFIEYSENEFLEHIKKHFIDNDEECKVESYFITDFPIIEVINEIKKYIPSDKGLYTGFGDSNYYFKYDGCGRYNKKIENFIKVACTYGTNNIITMHPIDYGENLPYVDLNYMVPKKVYKDTRKDNDRISKFYKRYNKKKD